VELNDEDWRKTWVKRGKDYHSANAAFPAAREAERDLLIDQLELHAGLTLLDVAAGGGYLLEKVHQRLRADIQLLAIESSEAFAAHLPRYVRRVPHGSITDFGLPDESVDRVTNLSGLHHTVEQRRFFEKAFRVLKPGGILGAADVREGSNVARWLNEFVAGHNPDGHDGRFFPAGQMTTLCVAAGFTGISEATVRYSWDFDSVERMVWFCRTLFGITADDDTILKGIKDILGYQSNNGRVHMNWELIRTIGRKGDGNGTGFSPGR
jgi:cyclopropane fatty-acyl-phospholipid synthase-like methyltransferase